MAREGAQARPEGHLPACPVWTWGRDAAGGDSQASGTRSPENCVMPEARIVTEHRPALMQQE